MLEIAVGCRLCVKNCLMIFWNFSRYKLKTQLQKKLQDDPFLDAGIAFENPAELPYQDEKQKDAASEAVLGVPELDIDQGLVAKIRKMSNVLGNRRASASSTATINSSFMTLYHFSLKVH